MAFIFLKSHSHNKGKNIVRSAVLNTLFVAFWLKAIRYFEQSDCCEKYCRWVKYTFRNVGGLEKVL